MGAEGTRRPLRRPRPVDRPLPAVPRPGLQRSRSASPATCAGPSASSTSWRRCGTDTVLVCSSVAPDAVDDPDRLAEQLAAAGRAAPATAACGSPTRRWPGDGTSRPGSARGTPSAAPTPPPSDSAWTASTCSPAAVTRPGSPRSPATSCSSSSSPTPRTWTWTCSSGAATTGCSPARARSTCPASSAHVLAAGYTRAAVARGVQRRLPPGRPGAGRPRRHAVAAVARGGARGAASRPRPGRGASGAGADSATRSPSSPSTGLSRAGGRRRAGRAGLHPHRPAPVQAGPAVGAGAGPGAAERLGRPAGGCRRGRGDGAGAGEPDPGSSGRAGRGAPGAGAPANAGRRRGRPVRGRRPRRDPGLLRPHRHRAAGRRTSCRPAPSTARGPGITARRPRGADPALRRLRRGRACSTARCSGWSRRRSPSSRHRSASCGAAP